MPPPLPSGQISGKDVYSRLKWEAGVHRVQRVPATESQGRIHTSTASVAIMPEPRGAPGDPGGWEGGHVSRGGGGVRTHHLSLPHPTPPLSSTPPPRAHRTLPAVDEVDVQIDPGMWPQSSLTPPQLFPHCPGIWKCFCQCSRFKQVLPICIASSTSSAEFVLDPAFFALKVSPSFSVWRLAGAITVQTAFCSL